MGYSSLLVYDPKEGAITPEDYSGMKLHKSKKKRLFGPKILPCSGPRGEMDFCFQSRNQRLFSLHFQWLEKAPSASPANYSMWVKRGSCLIFKTAKTCHPQGKIIRPALPCFAATTAFPSQNP